VSKSPRPYASYMRLTTSTLSRDTTGVSRSHGALTVPRSADRGGRGFRIGACVLLLGRRGSELAAL
jgi:hypothetical protein